MFPRCFFRASKFQNIVSPAVLELMFDVGNSTTSSAESSSQPLLLCVVAVAPGIISLASPVLISITFSGNGGKKCSSFNISSAA